MSGIAIFYYLLFAIYIIGSRVGLYKLFEKAGENGWKAFIPVYSDVIWIKMIGKPLFWVALTLIPIIRTLVKVSMDIEMAKAFDKQSFKDQAFAVLLPFVFYPKIGFDPETTYAGPPLSYEEAFKKYNKENPNKPLKRSPKKSNKTDAKRLQTKNHGVLAKAFPNVTPPKSGGREWADAFLFAGVAALIIRTFFIEAFMIPTSSMERTLMAGDFLFVSKYHYGTRMPMNPLSIPFIHNKIKIKGVSVPSYVKGVELPYFRLPGLEKIERNDIVVFNYPFHDIDDLGDGAGFVKITSLKENYIKRCVAIPGDTLQIIDANLHINGKPADEPEQKQIGYQVLLKPGKGFRADEFKDMGFRIARDQYGNIGFARDNNPNWYPSPMHSNLLVMHATEEIRQKLANHPSVDSMLPDVYEAGVKNPGDLYQGDLSRDYCVYPNDWDIAKFNRDNYGPILIPKKGMTVDMTDAFNYACFRRVIVDYEGHELKKLNGKVVIDGQETNTYTFEKDYYFMMGDNRHNSEDSRFWGYVPEDHIVGRPLFVFFSYESNFGVRLNRIGTKHID